MSDSMNLPKEDLVIRRIVAGPIGTVWRTWTEPKLVQRWWGPKYFTSPSCQIDLRVGGRYIFCMRAPHEMGGQDSYTAGIYKQIVPQKLLEFTQSLADRDGNPIDPVQAGMPPDFPKEMLTTVNFDEMGPFTRLTITVRGWTAGQMFVFALAGWHQSIDKFDDSLE